MKETKKMKLVSVKMPVGLLSIMEKWVEAGHFVSTAELVRAAVREYLREEGVLP